MRDWHAIGLFCEDIREEKSQQDTLIGILPDNISVPSFPGGIPKLGVYVRIHLSAETNIGSISITLHFPNGDKMLLGGFDDKLIREQRTLSGEKKNPFIGLVSKVIASPVVFTQAGRILLVINVGGEEMICGALNVELAPNPSSSALQQPAAQSPTAV
jgi:hypothetical protein